MTVKYLVLKEKIAHEIEDIKRVVAKIEQGYQIALKKEEERDFYIDSIAFNLHGFYSGIERIFELIAEGVDGELPSGNRWHKDLLDQMTINLPQVRCPVISEETRQEMLEFLAFRHLVRNIYTFELKPAKLENLVMMVPKTFDRFLEEINGFLLFLEKVGNEG